MYWLVKDETLPFWKKVPDTLLDMLEFLTLEFWPKEERKQQSLGIRQLKIFMSRDLFFNLWVFYSHRTPSNIYIKIKNQSHMNGISLNNFRKQQLSKETSIFNAQKYTWYSVHWCLSNKRFNEWWSNINFWFIPTHLGVNLRNKMKRSYKQKQWSND